MEVEHNQSVDVEQIDADDLEETDDGYVVEIENDSVTDQIIITPDEDDIEQIEETNSFAIPDPTTEFGVLAFIPNHRDVESSAGPGITATSAFGAGEVSRLQNGETIEYRSSHAEADHYGAGPKIEVTLE